MAQFLDLTGLARYKNKSDALYAKQDGSYEGMTVGNAEQLVSTVGVSDSAPYTFRTTGGSADVGDRMNLKAVVGGTIAWNQIIPTANKSVSLSFSESASYDQTAYNNLAIKVVSGHKVFTSAKLTRTISGNNKISLSAWQSSPRTLIGSIALNNGDSNGYASNIISIPDGVETLDTITFNNYSGKRGYEAGDSVAYDDYIVIDLTAMFGSTIADYVATLESGTAGAGVAWLEKYGYFTKPYYPYAAASLQSVKTSAHKMVGFNAYDHSTGKAKVVGGNVYQITGTYTALSLNGSTITPDASGYFTPSESGEITVTGGNSTNTCIHLKWDGERDGEYEPYEAHEYALSDITLRGMLKLDANNNLYYDGDRYLPDGTVERYWGERAYTSGDATDGSTMITDGTNTVYKLTTPTTESADPYTELQVCDDFGTEEFVDAATRDFDMPVGHNTVYQPNLRAKLEMAPNSPDGDGDYLVRQTNGVNEYVLFSEVKELPDYPTTDGTYVLKCTVADGTATLSWVSEE